MILGDEQVDGAVVIVVTADDGAGIFELNFVEADVRGDIFESVGTEIAEETDLASAFFRFSDGDEVDPAIVVVVDSSDAVGADPIGVGEVHSIEALCFVVPPECQARLRHVGEG